MLETHKRCSLRVFYQLFEFSNLHRRTLDGQEGQDRSEEALPHKSRGLTSLLDQDRERFVQQTLEGPMYYVFLNANIALPTRVDGHESLWDTLVQVFSNLPMT